MMNGWKRPRNKGVRGAIASRGLLADCCLWIFPRSCPASAHLLDLYPQHSPTFPQLSALLFCSIQQICFMETVTKKKGLWNPTHKEDEDTDIHSHKYTVTSSRHSSASLAAPASHSCTNIKICVPNDSKTLVFSSRKDLHFIVCICKPYTK